MQFQARDDDDEDFLFGCGLLLLFFFLTKYQKNCNRIAISEAASVDGVRQRHSNH